MPGGTHVALLSNGQKLQVSRLQSRIIRGRLLHRSQASGGLTVHLGPGEQRAWTFKVGAAPVRYALAVTYANGKEGENEVISISLDGVLVTSFLDRDSGDSVDGWNAFVTD